MQAFPETPKKYVWEVIVTQAQSLLGAVNEAYQDRSLQSHFKIPWGDGGAEHHCCQHAVGLRSPER